MEVYRLTIRFQYFAQEFDFIFVHQILGTYHHYQRSHTKFVIATNLPDVKVRTNITRNIIKPDWIVDSLRENRLLDYSKYLLYTNKNRAQPQIAFKACESKEKIENAEELDPFAISLKALNDKIKSEIEVKAPDEATAPTEDNRTGTAVDPNFLQDFLNNSRLHHIATLGTGFKYHINDLRKNHDGKFPQRDELKKLKRSETIQQSQEIVMHIDMDCFFVSVSLKKHLHLKGQPVAVTHSKGRSDTESTKDFHSYAEIASCSYEARAKGLKNGMFVGAAMKLCPELKTIPYDFEEYRQTAFTLYDTIAKFTLDIEAVSCDELYADLKNLLVDCQVDVMDFVSLLRQEIFDKTGCTCSVGVGGNRLQARMATKEAKPNGQFSLLSADVERYMRDQKIRDLPGVGPNTAYQLTNLKLETCGQLQSLPLQLLQQTFGKKFGETLQMMSRGVDDKPLVFEQVRKSVSVEVNYGIRFNEDFEVQAFLKQVAEELSKRCKEIGKKGKLLTLKIMVRAKDASVETTKFMGHGIAEKVSKSVQLLASTDDAITIHSNVLKLLAAFNIPPYELRGIGVQMAKLDEEKKDSVLLEMFKKVAERQQTNPQPRIKLEPVRVKTDISPAKSKKSSPIKKRGRPAKFAASSKANVTSITEMFATRKSTRINFKRTVEMIDPEVLAELPPEMVDEILKEYQMPDEDVGVEPDEPADEPTVVLVDEETSDDYHNLFLQQDWRMLVKSWISVDVDIEKAAQLEHDATQLVLTRNMNLIFIVMRFLHRNISDSESIEWKKKYNEIADTVQAAMLEVLNIRLSIPAKFVAQ